MYSFFYEFKIAVKIHVRRSICNILPNNQTTWRYGIKKETKNHSDYGNLKGNLSLLEMKIHE